MPNVNLIIDKQPGQDKFVVALVSSEDVISFHCTHNKQMCCYSKNLTKDEIKKLIVFLEGK